MSSPRGFWVRWRVPIAYPMCFVCFWFSWPTWRSLEIGFVVGLTGIIVRALAAGVVRKREELTTSGIYSWTRNPLYLGSVILAVAMVVTSRSWIVAVLVVGYLAAFYPVVIRSEEIFLREKFGEQFDAYSARVSVFLPWPSRIKQNGAKFSWRQWARNHEYRAPFGALAGFGIMIGRMWLHSKYW